MDVVGAFEAGLCRALSEEERGRARAELAAALASARDVCPDLRIGDEVFAAYLGERLSDEEDPLAALASRYTADLYLACGCTQGDPVALDIFERACLGAIGPAIRRIDPSAELLDEVRQQVRVIMLVREAGRAPKIASYRGTGRLTSWIRVAAVREALEVRRKSRRHDAQDDEALLGAADVDEDPELRHIRQLYRTEFRTAFAGALRDLESRERNLLRMHLVDGSSIDEIGLIYRVHRATAARWIARAREKLLARTRARLSEALSLSHEQFESLMGVVRSHLDLSIERLLTESRQSPRS